VRQLRSIFDDSVALRERSVLDDKLDPIFRVSCDYFFSLVQPLKNIDIMTDEEKEKNFYYQFDHTALIKERRTLPISYEDYLLPQTYILGIREVFNYFLKEDEKDNFELLQQVGAEINLDLEDSSFLELKALLDSLFDISLPIMLIGGETQIRDIDKDCPNDN